MALTMKSNVLLDVVSCTVVEITDFAVEHFAQF
jgi:hypothetical protein